MNTTDLKGIRVPEGYTIINLHISQWSGKRTLTTDDIDIDENITSKKLANLGSLNAFDTEKLNPFRNLSNKANNACKEFGVSFCGAYLFPTSKEAWLIDKLTDIKKDWATLKADIMSSYENELRAWAKLAEDEVAGFGAKVLAKAFKKDYIDKQLSFSWSGVDDEVESLGSRLLDEIAKKAREKQAKLAHKKALNKGNLKISRKDMVFFAAIRKKLMVNQILDHRVTPILNEILALEKCIDSFPKSHPLDKNQVAIAHYLKTLSILMNPDMLYGLGEEEEQQSDDESFLPICADDDFSAANSEESMADEPDNVQTENHQAPKQIEKKIDRVFDGDSLPDDISNLFF